jgi:hypothetical protein
LLVATVSLACSERTLTSERAASLIADLDQFKREAYFSIQTGVPLQTAFKCMDQAEIARTPLVSFGVERGWVRLESRETVLGFGAKKTCPSLALTQSGEAASTRWTRQRAESNEGVTWAVPIGRRGAINVTKLTTAPDGSTQVEFDWKWMPNDTGIVLRKSVQQANAFFDSVRKGRASCRRPDGQWQCQLGMWTTPADGLGEFRP